MLLFAFCAQIRIRVGFDFARTNSEARQNKQRGEDCTYQNATSSGLSADKLTSPVFGFGHPAEIA